MSPELRHGSLVAYKTHGCRCDLCRRAQREYQRAYTHRTGLHLPREIHLEQIRANPPAHGMASRYSKHGCRCDLCRAAATEQKRQWRLRNPDYDRDYSRKRRAVRHES